MHIPMTLMSPLRYRLHLAWKVLFGDNKIAYEVLMHHKANLPNSGVEVAWERDGEFIVGRVRTSDTEFIAQGLNAKEFVEMVNDATYAVYEVPLEYSEALGGDYRLIPSQEEFEQLDDKNVIRSVAHFRHIGASA